LACYKKFKFSSYERAINQNGPLGEQSSSNASIEHSFINPACQSVFEHDNVHSCSLNVAESQLLPSWLEDEIIIDDEINDISFDSAVNELALDEDFWRDYQDQTKMPESLSDEKEFIYDGSPHTLEQFKLAMSLFVTRFCLSDVCFQELLKLFIHFLPSPNKICRKPGAYKFYNF
jgi:hypothetical protein